VAEVGRHLRAHEAALINRHAAGLNAEMVDVLAFQAARDHE
jgi:hypothetical protein